MWEERTEVLVVGAGPVGIFTALLLAEAGLKVTILDEEWRTAVHSYACALHPHSLHLLNRVGLAEAALSCAFQVNRLAFYEGASQRAALDFRKLPAEFPMVAVLKQSTLESLLEERLKQKGVRVCWNHRLSALQMGNDSVTVTVDKLVGTATGYIVPRWEMVTQKQYQIEADFVVGADGHQSTVRQLLGIEYESYGPPQVYAVFECVASSHPGHELSVILDQAHASALWPLPENQYRWSFQLHPAVLSDQEFPNKQRRPVRFFSEKSDQDNHQHLQQLITERAPWFKIKAEELDWSLQIQFGCQLAQRYGQGRCWLVGDAAHQTSPVGIQSMNMGLCEADHLAAIFTQVLRQKAGLDLLQTYHQDFHHQWQRLLGQKGELRPGAQANSWMKDHAQAILPCLPASGKDLSWLLNQLGIEWLA